MLYVVSQNAEWSSELGVLVESGALTTSKQSPGRYQLLPALCLHATTHFKSLGSSILASIGTGGTRNNASAGSEQPHSSATTMTAGSTTSTSSAPSHLRKNDEFFYRCPLFKSRLQFATLQEPIAYIYMPTYQTAGLMTVHGVALFLSNDE